eukprot:TRINITY_DN12632_c0_g2_i1.p1 TRINITY_DN12632_c0_g2~~TRINITY_DN12632_c0_g2_i1.p1  ORF type:complete len:454 (-),score=113.66 TRINITY_DN12632_c0_g2_i1:1717-2988(-)
MNGACLEEDKENTNDETSSDSSDVYSSFEDDFDREHSFNEFLRVKLELASRSTKSLPFKAPRDEHKNLVYDSRAKLTRHLSPHHSRNGVAVSEEQVEPIAYSLKRCFDTEFITGKTASEGEKAGADLVYRNFVDGSFNKEAIIKEHISSFKSYAPEYTLNCPEHSEGVIFFSRFENANLQKVFNLSSTEYELYLSEDFNTGGHYHWFYFKTTSRLPANTRVTFRILNMTKPGSLYLAGFRPFAYSVKRASGWVQAGECVTYSPTEAQEASKKYYTLSWEYTYEFPNDEVYFAQFIPYTYSDLLDYLRKVKESEVARVDMLCKTIARNVCPMLTITEDVEEYISYTHERKISAMSKSTRKILYNRIEKFQSKSHKRKQTETTDSENCKADDLEVALLKHSERHKNKKGVVIVARVHPGTCFAKC